MIVKTSMGNVMVEDNNEEPVAYRFNVGQMKLAKSMMILAYDVKKNCGKGEDPSINTKICVIKTLRTHYNLGLAEAKAMYEAAEIYVLPENNTW